MNFLFIMFLVINGNNILIFIEINKYIIINVIVLVYDFNKFINFLILFLLFIIYYIFFFFKKYIYMIIEYYND